MNERQVTNHAGDIIFFADNVHKNMARARDSEGTRRKIVRAAVREFTDFGYEGTTISRIARRAGVSKQLLSHYFPTKETLFREVHDLRFRTAIPDEALPSEASDLMAERFLLRAKDVDYVRFLTWEAASGRNSSVPGRDTRLRRITEKASAIKKMQSRGEIRSDLDYRLIQLAITSLATYPLAFRQITRLVTGRDPTDEKFQKEWYRFLRTIGRTLFGKPPP